MQGSKLVQQSPIKTRNRTIYPIAHLGVNIYFKCFVNITYQVVALKIVEKDNIYYKNISMSENVFDELKNRGF